MRRSCIPHWWRGASVPSWLILGAVAGLLLAAAQAQNETDMGDAPLPYPTLLSQNGAVHIIQKNFSLGLQVDAENDGQPTLGADRDDTRPLAAPDDEDGVSFVTFPLRPGENARMRVVLTGQSGRLDAWIDFNADGDWDDKDDRIFQGQALQPGTNNLEAPVPADATVGVTFARFRLSLEGGLSYLGTAPNGEVEDYRVVIGRVTEDFGDAPAPFPTTLDKGGARHTVVPGFHLGSVLDAETDGQPATMADGDDTKPAGGPDDEDGIQFLNPPLQPGISAQVRVRATQKGRLDAWVDFNHDGDWTDDGERIFGAQNLDAGTNILSFAVPAGAVTAGDSMSRFRFSELGDLSYDGPIQGAAPDGEVEDHPVAIGEPVDWGDAPDTYRTTLERDGPRHPYRENLFLGKLVDFEPDGQPTTNALGDDLNPPAGADDEDGVEFTSALRAGLMATLDVMVAAGLRGGLDAWVDFNGDGSFAEPGERIFTNLTVNAGPNSLAFRVPASAVPGATFARFRLSQKGGLPPTGPADDGEVEDYQVLLSASQDWGDAPASYRTTLKDDGPRHLFRDGMFLGRTVDLESDGQPGAGAEGDDKNPTAGPDDEDGVFFSGPLVAGQTATVRVVASTRGQLDAWVDFFFDGNFSNPNAQIFLNRSLNPGTNVLTFNVPANSVAIGSYARFRFSEKGGLPPTGPADDGEVEDHYVTIQRNLDFGDAPYPPYPTRLGNNGARHFYSPSVFLGSHIDLEPDGQPNADATGDDLNPAGGPDDEDGVFFTSSLRVGRPATVRVIASTRGALNAWIDFGNDWSWAEAGDQIFTNLIISPGTNNLVFNVPDTAVVGSTFGRFRFSLQGYISYDGEAGDGEVEDYEVMIEAPCERTNRGRDFWLTFPGNYAPDPANPVRLRLCIVGPRNTAGLVEIPGLGWATNFLIGADLKATIFLPRQADLGDANDQVQTNGVHVTAGNEVAVFGLSRVFYTSDGYLGLPSDVLGRQYLIQAFGNEHRGVPPLNGTQFGLVACEDDTKVTIIPSVDTTGHPAKTPYTFTLGQGQTYQLRNTNDWPRDLSGTLVQANKPVAVFGGHHCANVPDTNVWFCDYMVEQLLPLARAGTEFVAMPLATRVDGDNFRFFAVQTNTQVYVNGALVATLDQGEFHDEIVKDPAHITAEKPIFTVQYANSSDFDHVTNADPFQLVVPAVELFRTEYEICVPDAGFVENYVNLVVPGAGLGTIRLDGVLIPAASFVPIAGSGYHGASVSVLPGAHFLTGGGVAGGPVAFGVSVYGWAEYDSYGYPGGMFFADASAPEVTCQTNLVVINAGLPTGDPCRGRVPDLRDLVTFTDNCGVTTNVFVRQSPIPGTILPVGDHDITMSVTDEAGNSDSCIIILRVVDRTAPRIDCPADLVVTCQSDEGSIVEFVVTASTECGFPLAAVCNPPSGSLFPPGVTTVNCATTNTIGEVATCSFTVTVRCLTLDFGPVPGTLTLSWPGGGILQSASELGNPQAWTTEQNAPNPYVIFPSETQRFYRVIYPLIDQ